MSVTRSASCTRAQSRAREAGDVEPVTEPWRLRRLQPILLLHQLPVRILVQNFVAAELIDVAAAIVEPLAVGAGAGDHPHADGAVAADERVNVVPTHVADDLEPVGEHFADGGLAA